MKSQSIVALITTVNHDVVDDLVRDGDDQIQT